MSATPHRLVRAGSPLALDLGELWAQRELALLLVRRDVTVRYRQTLLGVGWAVLQPALATAVFTLVLGVLVGVAAEAEPYAVFAYLGLWPWSFFSGALARAASSLQANAPLLGRIYFPRLLLPISAVLSAAVDLACALPPLVLLLIVFGTPPAGTALLALPFLVLAALLALGLGSALSALSLRRRDLSHGLPFLLPLGMWATPVVYPLGLAPEPLRSLLRLNPMTGIVEGVRAAFLGRPLPLEEGLLSLLGVALLLALGLAVFRARERELADVA
jgi:lipopolysaccharide transport system permease protein